MSPIAKALILIGGIWIVATVILVILGQIYA